MARRGILALEELDNEVPAEDTPAPAPAEVTDFVEAPENELAEAVAASDEIDQAEDDIERVEAGAEAVEDIAQAAEASVEEGGLSETAAEVTRVATEHLLKSMGFHKSYRRPAFEGFKTCTNRAEQTKIAVEDLKEKAAQVWAKIKEWIGKLVAGLKKVWDTVLNYLVKEQLRMKQLAAKAKSMGDAAPAADANVASPKFAKLVVGTAVPEGQAFVSAYQKHISGFEGKFSADTVKQAASKIWTAEGGAEQNASIEVAKLWGVTPSADGKASEILDLEFGNAKLTMKLVDGGLVSDIAAGDVKVPETVKPLSAKEVEAVCEGGARAIENLKKAIKEGEAAVTEFEKAMTTAESKKVEPKEATKLAKLAWNGGPGVLKKLQSYEVQLTNTVVNFCAASLRACAAPAKKEEPAPAAA